jgi:hypothetical protein
MSGVIWRYRALTAALLLGSPCLAAVITISAALSAGHFFSTAPATPLVTAGAVAVFSLNGFLAVAGSAIGGLRLGATQSRKVTAAVATALLGFAAYYFISVYVRYAIYVAFGR